MSTSSSFSLDFSLSWRMDDARETPVKADAVVTCQKAWISFKGQLYAFAGGPNVLLLSVGSLLLLAKM